MHRAARFGGAAADGRVERVPARAGESAAGVRATCDLRGRHDGRVSHVRVGPGRRQFIMDP